VSLSQRDQRRVANFTVRVGVKRPTDDKKPAAAGAAAQAGTKG